MDSMYGMCVSGIQFVIHVLQHPYHDSTFNSCSVEGDGISHVKSLKILYVMVFYM